MPTDAAWFGSPVPGPRHHRRRPQHAGIHRGPPGIPLPSLLTRYLPSPCGRPPRPRITAAEAPPRPDAFGRRWTCPPPHWQHNGRDNPGSVPTFTIFRIFRSTRETPSTSPAASLPGTPQTFPESLEFPPGRTQPVTEPPSRSAAEDAHCCPPHIRQIRAGSTLKEVLTLVHYSRYTFSSCLPDPNRLTVPTRPSALGAASRPSPAPPRPGLLAASADRCDSPLARVSHPHTQTHRLMAHPHYMEAVEHMAGIAEVFVDGAFVEAGPSVTTTFDAAVPAGPCSANLC